MVYSCEQKIYTSKIFWIWTQGGALTSPCHERKRLSIDLNLTLTYLTQHKCLFFLFFCWYWWEKEIHQKGASPKGLDWPLHREKKKKRGILWAGYELKVSVDASLKQLKVISRGKDGGWEWVPVSAGHRDKRIGESARSIFIHFDSKGVLNVWKPRSSKEGFTGNNWFQLDWTDTMIISVVQRKGRLVIILY